MPRHYARKTTGGRKYTTSTAKEILDKAKKAMVKENLSVRAAAERFDVSRSTLHDYVSKIHMKKTGGQTVLNEEEEKILVKRLITMGVWGFPLDAMDLRMLVKAYLDRRGVNVKKFTNNIPGRDWVTSFIRRHKQQLTTRLSENIKVNQAKGGSAVIKKYFENLGKTLEGVPPENVVNYDETNLTDDPGKKKAIFRRGTKYPERVINSTKTSISVMFAGSASGHLLPPYIVYKAIHLYDVWTTGGPPGVRYNRSSSGWFDAVTFEDWFNKIVLPYMKKLKGKKVLLGDNLASHISPNVIESCEKNDISFTLLPPNSTNLTQPLDVAVFRPLKRIWRDILYKFKETAIGRQYASLPKDHFPGLLKKLMIKLDATISDNLKSGFRKCGVVPLNPDIVLSRLPDDDEDAPLDNAEDPSASLDDSLVGILRSMRYGNEEQAGPSNVRTGPNRKKKRLAVVPGKSVTSKVFRPDENNSTTSMSEDDIDDPDPSKSPTSIDPSVPGPSRDPTSVPTMVPRREEASDDIDDDESTSTSVRELNIVPSNWLLTKFFCQTKKQYRYFIAVVEKVEPELYVRFLKHIPGTKHIFVNPPIDEFSTLNTDDIVKVLPEPELDRKCRMIFDVDVGLWPK